jgi:cell division protein FtsA
MATVSSDRVWVSIDIGTTKICVLVAHHLTGDSLEILGVGKAPSDGLSKGVVVDIAKTIRSIKQAVKEAELMAGFPIETAHIGISGAHIRSINSHGVVPIRKNEVRHDDIAAVIEAAQAIPIAEGQQILHVLPQYFIIDGQEKVKDPIGMYGIRLEAQVHIITGSVASAQNLVKCCQAAGIQAADIILEQLASADAVLTEDERELGVGVLDIGGGTSDLALYQHGNIRHTMVLPMAGNHFTNDIAIGLHTTLKEAERIKREYGLAKRSLLKEDDLIEVEMVQGAEKRIALLHDLVNIIEPRANELLSLVHEDIIRYHLKPFMRSGLVLTGGGSLLRGMKELAEEIFEVPVRVGAPRSYYTLPELLSSPIYATAYGLLVHALRKQGVASLNAQAPLATRVFDRMKSWVADFF